MNDWIVVNKQTQICAPNEMWLRLHSKFFHSNCLHNTNECDEDKGFIHKLLRIIIIIGSVLSVLFHCYNEYFASMPVIQLKSDYGIDVGKYFSIIDFQFNTENSFIHSPIHSIPYRTFSIQTTNNLIKCYE